MLTTWRKLLALLSRNECWQLLGLLAATIVMSLMQALGVGSIMPFVSLLVNPELIYKNARMNWAFTTLGFGDPKKFLFFIGFFVLGLLIFSNAFMALTQWLTIRFVWSKQYSLSQQLLERYLFWPYINFLGRNSADTGKNVLTEVQILTTNALFPSLEMVVFGITALSIISLVIWLNPFLASILLVALGGGYILLYLMVQHRIADAGRRRIRATTLRFKAVDEAFGSIKEVKVLGNERNMLAHYTGPAKRYADAQMTQQLCRQLPRYAIETVAFGSMILIVLYMMLIEGDLSETIPLVSVYAFAAYRVIPTLQHLYGETIQVRFNKVVVDTIYEDMIGSPKEWGQLCPVEHTSARLTFTHEVRLQDLSFTYPDSRIAAIHNVNVTLPRHTSAAFVGETGSGKTTLLDIVLGLLRPERGMLSVDGVEINDRNLRAWQNILGYVPQHIYLSDDTVARNIAFGVSPECINREAMEKAARIASIHEFIITELPYGYETIIGEHGVRLSGGQQQRIGIARALYHDPEVLVMDEATNSLDSLTEEDVIQAIEQAAMAKTVIMVAHRLTTVRNCDMIYLLEKGRIVAQGTFEELINGNARFRALARGIQA